MLRLWLVAVFAAAFAVIGVNADEDQQINCMTMLTCSDCYTTDGCIFCGAKDLNSTLARCVSQQNIPAAWNDLCPVEDRYKTESKHTITDDSEMGGRRIRLSPSKMDIEIGKHQSHNVTISVEIKDNPKPELYILMDLSRSMWDDKKTLEKIIRELLGELQSLTTDTPKMGFGAFVDKPVLPYISLAPTEINDTETCKNVNCDEPWGFRNYVKLTTSAEDVEVAISNAPVAVNLDPLEGGFDGVMQAMVCKEVIGWEDGTQKMIVYLSDATPHMAGDGKLAGIMIPNDMECHMEESKGTPYKHSYSYSKSMDYPSVGQLNQKAEENGISLIFLVTQKKMPLYRRISQIITSSSFAEIQEDSSNIVELIRTEYEKVQSKVSLKDEGTSEAISLRYFSKCKNNQLEEKKNCDDLNKGDKVDFTIEVTLNNCDDFEDGVSQKIKISPFGDDKNHVELTVYPLCTCDCEDSKHDDYDKSSPDCNFQGDLKCGVCDCQDGFGGKTCQCDKSAIDAGSSGCRPGNSTVECKGRGTCVCNECECDPGYKGTFCECDNINCDRGIGGLVCSNNGDCDCGVCSCHSGWTGDACACSLKTDNCINPASDIVCSSQGSCECNTCKCNNTVYSYTGVWCETCKDCPDQCEELGPCVLCQHRSQEESESQCEDQCSDFQLEVTFLDHMDEPSEGDVLCSVYDNEECRVSFVYGPGDDGKLNLQILKNKECPKPVPIIAIVLGIVGTIVVLGLIALIAWKCYISHLDKLEYQRFLMEQSNAKWSNQTNPMYKPAIKTTMNPTYSKQD